MQTHEGQFLEAFRELLEKSPPPKWLVDMVNRYRETGSFRPEDLHRLLGDINKGVEISPDATVEGILSQHLNQAGCFPIGSR